VVREVAESTLPHSRFFLLDIRDNHILDQGGLARSGLADDVHMAPSVFIFDLESPPDIPVVSDGKGGERIFVIFRVEHGGCLNHIPLKYAEKREDLSLKKNSCIFENLNQKMESSPQRPELTPDQINTLKLLNMSSSLKIQKIDIKA
jgi:hypothetical protein